jgi:hypothetical protein
MDWLVIKSFLLIVEVTLSAPAWDGSTGGILAILAKETVTITGTI